MDAPVEPMKVSVGTHVKLELVSYRGEIEPLEVDIVPDQVADFRSGLLGESTPLARAILGQVAGAKVPYKVDDIAQAHILSVEPATRETYGDVAARKKAILRKAINQSDLTSTIIYASSMNSKWGDYEPPDLDENWDKE